MESLRAARLGMSRGRNVICADPEVTVTRDARIVVRDVSRGDQRRDLPLGWLSDVSWLFLKCSGLASDGHRLPPHPRRPRDFGAASERHSTDAPAGVCGSPPFPAAVPERFRLLGRLEKSFENVQTTCDEAQVASPRQGAVGEAKDMRRSGIMPTAKANTRGLLGRREFLRSAGVLSGALVAGGLLSSCQETSTRQGQDEGDLQSISLAASSYPAGGTSLPIVMALQDPEILERHGLSLEESNVIPAVGGGEVMRNLALGDLDFGHGSPIATIRAFNAGVPIQVIGSIGSGTVSWIVPADSPIKSLEEVRGGKLSISSPLGTTNAAAIIALDAIGIAEDVELVATGDERESWVAVQRGIVDVVSTNLFSQTPLIDSGEARSIGSIVDYEPDFVDDWLISSVATVDERPNIVRSWLDAYSEIGSSIVEDPEHAAQLYASFTDSPANDAQTGIESLPEGHYDIGVKVEYISAAQRAMFLMDLISSEIVDPDGETSVWQSLINQDFLPEGERVDIPGTIPL